MAKGQKEIRQFLGTVHARVPDETSEWPHAVNQAVQYMCKRWYEELTVDNLKSAVYAGNGNHFSSEFAYHTGKPPIEYINDLRVEAAKQILSEKRFSNVRINTIAREIGFSGKGNFHHAFRKREGISPGKWRKQRLRKK